MDRLRSVSRDTLRLPEDVFLFLYIFDFNSYLARKNPFATIDAFRRAFPDDDTVGLVFKTMNSQAQDPVWRKFLAACQADKRIHLLDRTLERGEILGLVESCDAYVSLHRSEGFGRTLAEAMLLGKPVVGTDFSGNRDFLDADLGFPVRWRRRAVKPGEYPFVNAADRAWWAEPLTADAARQMQAARRRQPEAGPRVREAAENHFSPSRVGGLMRARLQALAGSA